MTDENKFHVEAVDPETKKVVGSGDFPDIADAVNFIVELMSKKGTWLVGVVTAIAIILFFWWW